MNGIKLTDLKSLLFSNITTKQTIFKNTFWLSVSLGVSKLLGLLLLIYAARILGAEEYGKFTFALSFVSLFVSFCSFGLPSIIVREFSQNKEKKESFYSVISLQMLLTFLAFIIILGSSFFITQEFYIQKIILTLALFSLINNFIAVFQAFFEAHQKMEYEAWVLILQYLLMFFLGFCVLFWAPSAENLGYAYFYSALIALIFVLFFFNFKIFSLNVKWNFFVWRRFLSMSWPLALSGFLGSIYAYSDSVIMGHLGMLTETGWYNAASKIILASLVPMGLISGSFYPALSRYSYDSREKFQKIWSYQLEIMILLATPLMVGGIILASKIINSFYPADFSPSILTFQILILMAGISFIYRPFYDAMIALNHQAKIFWIALAGALVNIVLNLILIPKFSLYGAAFATVIAYLVILLISIWLTSKFTPIRISYLKLLLILVLAGLSSILMYFLISQPVVYNLNIFISVAAGALIYFVSFFILKKIAKLIYEKI